MSGAITKALVGGCLAVAAIVTLPAPHAWAPHSHGNYVDTFIDIEGVVKEAHFLNPHSWIYLTVKSATGQPQTWALEATNRISLDRMGVTKGYLQTGDSVKARCHPLRDGSRGCLLGFLKARDGSVRDWDGNNLPVPADF